MPLLCFTSIKEVDKGLQIFRKETNSILRERTALSEHTSASDLEPDNKTP